MKALKTSLLALIIGASFGLPATAQQKVADQPEASETALEFARRVNACDGSEVLSAKYMDGRESLHVRCSQGAAAELSGMSGGLGTGGALALGGGALIAIIALASGGSSSGSTTSTTGTN